MMTDYIHIWEVMKDRNNDPNSKVVVKLRCREKLVKVLYRGKLKDIPAEVALSKVDSMEYSLVDKCPVILTADWTDEEMEDFKDDLIERCRENPKLAKQVLHFVTASEYGQQQMLSQALLKVLES